LPTVSVCEYCAPSEAEGNEAGTIVGDGGQLMAMLTLAAGEITGGLAESVTVTLKLKFPFGPVGVPVTVPFPFSVKPAGGRVPPAAAHVSAPDPPAATSVSLVTVTNSVAAVSEVVVTVGVGLMAMVMVFD